jgi:hypothetical protein
MQIQLPNSPKLCSRCTIALPLLVDISSPGKNFPAHKQWWAETYGKLSEGIQGLLPDTCELCHVLQKAFSKVPGFDVATTKININTRSLGTFKGLQHHTCTFSACGRTFQFAPGIPTVTTDDGEKVYSFTARPVVPPFNPLLAKLWLTKCQQHTICQPDYSPKDFKFPFRVIDVQSGRLVEAMPDVRYVALSYVWGGVRQVMLNHLTRPYLEKEGSITPAGLTPPKGEYLHVGLQLEEEGRTIPRTICDAIRLCQMIGERYLWTDSLCILQDEEYMDGNGAWTNADKMAQIPNMNIIYGASVLTIIAAHGKDSNAGLPGVHPSNSRTSQIIGKIGDQMFLSYQDDPMHAFFRSEWLKRAWTFQEFILSKRHIIFLPEQVVFHCHTLSWCEDHFMEMLDSPEDIKAVPVWSHSAKLHPLQLPDRSKWSDDIFFPAIFINQFYVEWLRDFLKRRLTVATDILFAFDGALSAARQYLGEFHHGLPLEYFCETLGWSVGLASWYYGKDPHQGLTQRRKGFPSWSWTGWMWDVASFEQFHVNYQGKNPQHWRHVGIWGTRTSCDGELEFFQIAIPDMDRWKDLDFFSTSAFEVDDEWVHRELETQLAMIKSSSTPLNYLIIKTLTAFAFVSSQHRVDHNGALRVYSRPEYLSENLVGIVQLSKTWQHRADNGLRIQVIITSSSFSGRSTQFPDQTDEDNPTIGCLVVEAIGHGTFERQAIFRDSYSKMQMLAWTPITAILR